MNDREIEDRLKVWLDGERGARAPSSLRARVAAIPATYELPWRARFAARLGLRATTRTVAVVLVLVAILVAVVATTILSGAGARLSLEASPALSAGPSAPADAATPSPALDVQVEWLEASYWQLDFAQSGLSTEPLPGGGPPLPLGSSIAFHRGQLLGGTGRGGGCDLFDGSYVARGQHLSVTLRPGPADPCGSASAAEIRSKIGRVAAFSAGDCTGPAVSWFPDLGPFADCHSLRLLDATGAILLVYHAAVPGS